MQQVVRFIKDSYNEFVHKVERPKWAELMTDARLIGVFTLVMLFILYGIDSFFSVFLENLYVLLKKF